MKFRHVGLQTPYMLLLLETRSWPWKHLLSACLQLRKQNCHRVPKIAYEGSKMNSKDMESKMNSQ